MTKFKIKTKDSILFINKVFVLDATSKVEAEEYVKANYPNSKILSVEEVEDD